MDSLDKGTYCFYSMYSWIFEYLEREFGREALKKYWEHIGIEYYSRLIEDIKKSGLVALENYYVNNLGNEESKEEVEINRDENIFKIKTNNCNAIKWLKTQKINDCAFCQDSYYKDYCNHCKVINEAIANKSGLIFDINYDNRGKCVQIYRKVYE